MLSIQAPLPCVAPNEPGGDICCIYSILLLTVVLCSKHSIYVHDFWGSSPHYYYFVSIYLAWYYSCSQHCDTEKCSCRTLLWEKARDAYYPLICYVDSPQHSCWYEGGYQLIYNPMCTAPAARSAYLLSSKLLLYFRSLQRRLLD